MVKPKGFRQIIVDFQAAHAQAIEATMLAAQYQLMIIERLDALLRQIDRNRLTPPQTEALHFTTRCAAEMSNGAHNLLTWRAGKFDPKRIEDNVNVALRGWLQKLIDANPPHPPIVEELKKVYADLLENAAGL